MKNRISILITLFTVLFHISCEYDLEITQNVISATSNTLIKEEYKYGDTGGKCSIDGACLSDDKQKIGFYGLYGFGESAKGIVGELSVDGTLLWQETVDVNYDSRDIVNVNGGFLFYGTKNSNDIYSYFLYFISSENKKVTAISIPKPNGNEISHIYHIENLGNDELLFYLYDETSYYYAKFRFENGVIQLSSNWLSSNLYVSIASVIPVTNGYEIAGGTGIMSPDISDISFLDIYFRKIKLTATTAETKLNKRMITYYNKATYYMPKKAQIVAENKIFVTLDNSVMCWDYETGYHIWSTNVGSFWPEAIIYDNNKIILTDSYNISYRSYGCIDTYDLNGALLTNHTFGLSIAEQGINSTLVNGQQLYLLGFTDKRYDSDNPNNDWFIPYDGFKGWFFKVNLSDL
jgi:hypothetical protein